MLIIVGELANLCFDGFVVLLRVNVLQTCTQACSTECKVVMHDKHTQTEIIIRWQTMTPIIYHLETVVKRIPQPMRA